MMRCKYWDCGWCYCKTGNSNDINGKCMSPMECQQLAGYEQTAQQHKNEDAKMTEQNIRDAFEREPEYSGFDKSRCNDGEYEYFTTNDYYQTFKSGWIAAFKVILESEE